MNIIETMKQALEQLQRLACDYDSHGVVVKLRNAIAEIEKEEPVAWMVYTEDGKSVYVTDNPVDIGANERALPLYPRKDQP